MDLIQDISDKFKDLLIYDPFNLFDTYDPDAGRRFRIITKHIDIKNIDSYREREKVIVEYIKALGKTITDEYPGLEYDYEKVSGVGWYIIVYKTTIEEYQEEKQKLLDRLSVVQKKIDDGGIYPYDNYK